MIKIFKVKLFVIFMVINNGQYIEFQSNTKDLEQCERWAELYNEKEGNEHKKYVCREIEHIIFEHELEPSQEEE